MKCLMSVFYCLVVFVLVRATPTNVQDAIQLQQGAIASAIELGKWDKVEKIVAEALIQTVENDNIAAANLKSGLPLLRGSVQSLRPPAGGHVYGESNFQFQHTMDNGGYLQRRSGGHKVVNNDGKVTEVEY